MVSVERLRRLVLEDTGLGDVILRAVLAAALDTYRGWRRVPRAGVVLLARHPRLREFAARNRLPTGSSTWIRTRGRIAAAPPRHQAHSTPVVIWRGDCVLRNPSNAELARLIGLPGGSRAVGCTTSIVGGGPAGLAAAVYGASEGCDTCCSTAWLPVVRPVCRARIENYLGFPAGPVGRRAGRARRAAGREVRRRADASRATAVALERRTATGRCACATAPARRHGGDDRDRRGYRRLTVPDLARFEGTSVYYAATLVEAHLCVGEPVIVVGGGNSAGQAAVFLAAGAPRRCDWSSASPIWARTCLAT